MKICVRRGPLEWLLAVALATSGPAAAQIVKPPDSALSKLTLRSEVLAPSQVIVPLTEPRSAAPSAVRSAWETFRGRTKVEWRASIDQRNGLVAAAEGGGIAWIPGRGNSLTPADVSLATLEAIARRELERLGPLLGVTGKDLVLNQGRSGHPADSLWLVDFDFVRDGSVVEGAHVVFRVNNGNLIELGSELLPSPGARIPATAVDRSKARAVMAKYVGGLTAKDTFLDTGSVHLLPANAGSAGEAGGFAPGQGRRIVKVWQFVFRRSGVLGTWQARVDASSGMLLAFEDINAYATAQITGGVFQSSPAAGPEITRAMPFADAGASTANSAGEYHFIGATHSTLNGRFVQIFDTCGAISQASDGAGDIIFGTSGGTNCITPGHGGGGNTHSSRTQFYQVNRIKEVGRAWLPGNLWLTQKLPVNVNLNQTCNAFWNGASLNFFKSGGGCGNTGEISAVSLHEYGHGLDQNDGTPLENTSEAYADVTSVIALHDSCVGPGFFGHNCVGYGDACTACTGVRDVDFAKHASNTPATVSNFTRVRCVSGGGPCGREVHCESYVASEAIWDFANRDLPNPGTGSAWTILDRLWYLSRPSSTSGFSCTTAAGTLISNGCNIGSWWKTMRAVDDDDGDLTNGTPHGGALFAAFDRHGIACPTDPGANVTFAGCTPPPAPTLAVALADNSVAVTVTGTGVFDVYRNEVGCNAGFTRIRNDFAGGTFHDSGAGKGATYFYQAIAQPSGNEACASAPAACQSVTFPELSCLEECGQERKDCVAEAGQPGNPTLADCAQAFNVCKGKCNQPPPPPPQPPRLTVRKVLSPAGDPGRFNLRIDGTVRASGVGSGGSTGAIEVSAGTHTVSETAAPGTDLANYTRTIGGDCAPGGSVTVAAGQSKTCTITNVRKPDPACAADCKQDRDECMAGLGKPGNPTAAQCAQGFNSCLAHCPPAT